MSESILKALMQLFAIIANVEDDGVSTSARTIVKKYLEQHLNKQLVKEYLSLFDKYIGIHHKDITRKDGRKIRKRTSANSVKILMICRQINEELQQKQKVLVLLQLLEFINEDKEISEMELDFVNTVADIFNIAEIEYNNLKAFIHGYADNVPEKDKLLIIDNIEISIETDIKYLLNSSLESEVTFLHISSVNMYVFKHLGEDDLFLNGHSVHPNHVYVLNHGGSIRSSKVKPIYYSDVASAFLQGVDKSKLVFTAKNVEFKFPNSDNGIQKFNFIEESGKLVGIMGGSGVGKSTLLNVLNGNLTPKNGIISINGNDIHNNKDKLEGVIGFIPQDDLLIEELTVNQNLYYNAKLCFKKYTEEQIEKAVDDVLLDLDLYGIKDLIVGGPLNKFISGGQRKRLNIALELIREPSVLFVDEPTSGLSSMDSDMVMDLLKEQSLKGRLVIVNIHQPSSDIFKLFDKLLVMDKGGYPIYNGNPVDAIIYFKQMSHQANAEESECMCCGNVNPEQVLQIIEAKVVDEFGKLTRERKVAPKDWYEMYLENIEAKQEMYDSTMPIPENHFKIPSGFTQLKIFSIRNVLSKLSDKQYLAINFFEAPLLAFILAYLSKYIIGEVGDSSKYIFSDNENLPAFLFMSVVVSLFIGLSVSAEEIIKDRKILKREKFLNLSRLSYLNSKIVVLFIISAIQTISYIIVGNFILDIKGMTTSYFIILFSTSACANMIGLNISSALNSVVTIYILIPFILVPQLLLSGVIVKFDKLHKSLASHYYVPVVGDLMTSRWAYEALAVEQFKNNKYQKQLFDIECIGSNVGFQKNYLLKELESKLTQCQKKFKTDSLKPEVIRNLNILKNEISNYDSIEVFKDFDKLNINDFNSDISKKTKKYLIRIRKKYLKIDAKIQTQKNEKIKAMMAQYPNKNLFIQFKKNYFNSSLADMVLNKQELHKILETEDGLIQKAEPIYLYPKNNFGRAHFYAPVKIVAGKPIDTFWFNTIVLWLMSLLMYITLCNDTFRKIIDFGGKLKLPKFGKKKN